MNIKSPTKALFLIFSCLLTPTAAFNAELTPYQHRDSYNFSLPDIKNKTHTLSDYHGKVILVNFWASWCPPCIYEMPELTRLKEQLADKPFEILAINVGEKKYRVRKFVKLINFNLAVLLDTSEDTFDSWGVKTLPTSFLIDASGNIRYRVRGNPDWQDNKTVATIEQLISEYTKNNKHHKIETINEANR